MYGNHVGDNLSDDSGDPNNNTVTVNEGVTVGGQVHGGFAPYDSGKTATGNKVFIYGTAEGDVLGGNSLSGTDAMGNEVTVIDGKANAVVGGSVMNGNGNATGNTVTLKNAVITDGVLGGQGEGGDAVTGNTLNLSGTNTVGVNVLNFETINIKSLNANVLSLMGNYSSSGIKDNPTIKIALDKPEEYVPDNTAKKLIVCPDDRATISADATFDPTQAYTVTPGAGVTVDAEITGTGNLTTTQLSYTPRRTRPQS